VRARRAAAAAFALLAVAAFARGSRQDAAEPAEPLRERLEQMEAVDRFVVDDTPLALPRALTLLYRSNGYQEFWTPERLEILLGVLQDSAQDGLTPEDYHLAALSRLAPGFRGAAPMARANTDLLATDGFVLLLDHLYRGKVDPRSLDPRWNYELRPIREKSALEFVSTALNKGRFKEAIEQVRPQHWWYERALASLADYRAIAARGGWVAIAPGPALKAGATGERVAALRRRLAATGDLPGSVAEGSAFDETLAQAVRGFQTRHRMTADGYAGPGTLAALNVPVEDRIRQIRANLERARWVLHDLPEGPIVLVDIAGFEVSYRRGEEPLWQARIQVGKPYRQTPIFRSAIDLIVFNPTWTVPPTILAKDVLPEARRNPRYLASKKLEVLDRNGKPVDPASIDWAKATPKNFPYMLRQGPGPDNALGRVKFLFPNPDFVYLHDTPSKALFEKDERAFSSGCIRVQDPLELARWLLDDKGDWSAETIAAVIDAGATRTVRLKRPVPVLLLYWTILPSDKGQTVFKYDPYDRDPPLEKALDEPLRGPVSIQFTADGSGTGK
jgi:murein L,D-transpeptidase YcbB/YkuD